VEEAVVEEAVVDEAVVDEGPRLSKTHSRMAGAEAERAVAATNVCSKYTTIPQSWVSADVRTEIY